MEADQWELDPGRSWHLNTSPALLPAPPWLVLRHDGAVWPEDGMGDHETSWFSWEVEAGLVTPHLIFAFPLVPAAVLLIIKFIRMTLISKIIWFQVYKSIIHRCVLHCVPTTQSLLLPSPCI